MRYFLAISLELNLLILLYPLLMNLFLIFSSEINNFKPLLISFIDKGFTNKAESPATNGIDDTLDVITTLPTVLASSIGIPNPSLVDIKLIISELIYSILFCLWNA